MFELDSRLILAEEEVGPDSALYPRHALYLFDEPRLVTVEVGRWLPNTRGRWEERPIWLRANGASKNPVAGAMHAWFRTVDNNWYGIADVELFSPRGKLHLVLPGQVIPAGALAPADGRTSLSRRG